MLPFLGLIGCIKEEIKPVRVHKLNSIFNPPPTPPGPSYSTEYQAVIDRALVLGTVWTSTTQSTNPTTLTMDGAESVQFGNFVYIIGGWNEITTPRAQKTVYVAPAGDLTSWTQLSDAPWEPRHTFGCGVLNGKLYIWGADRVSEVGDLSHDCWSATQDVNGVLTWTICCALLPYSRRAIFGSCVHGGYLYTLGGEDYTSDTPPTDVWRSSDGITWSKIGDGISAFGGNFAGGLASFNNKLYTFGGGRNYVWSGSATFSQHTYINNIYVSNDNGVSWSSAANNLTTASHYLRTAVFDNKVWIIQGLNQNNAVFYMDTDETITAPTIVNKYWQQQYHAVSACNVTYNGTELLCCSHGTITSSTKYVLTIAKSYSGYDAPTDTQKGYQDTLIGLVKSNSWFSGTSAFKCFYVFNYGSSGYSTINWVAPTLYQLTRNNSPTWTDGAGFSGNGSNMWLQPNGLNPSALSNISETNCSAFAYVNNEMSIGLFAIFGGSPSINSQSFFYIAPRYTSALLSGSMYGATGDATTSQTSGSKALWHIVRNTSANWKIYRDKVLVGTITSASDATKFANKLSILSGIASTATRFSDAQLSCFGFGPAIDNTALNDMWDAYKTLSGL